MAWMICVGALFVLFLVVAVRTNPPIAFGVFVPIAMVFPAWVQWHLFSLPDGTVVGAGMDVKIALSSLALICYSFLPGASFPVKLVLSDYAMIGLVGVHGISDLVNTGPSWLIVPRLYAEWYVPYICGRLAFQYRRDMNAIWPVLSLIASVLAFCSVFEAIARINVFELIFGLRPEEQTPRDADRWGLRRAYGPCLNPIYFGLLQLLLAGWSFYAAHRAYLRRANPLWMLTPLLSIAGIACTCSRGPILGLVLFALAVLFVRVQRSRMPLFCIAILSVVLVVAFRERVVVLLENWSGESQRIGNKSLVVNQEELMKFSGTRSRLIMLEMYRVALFRSGLIGYGTEAVTGFPIHVPIGPQEAETLKRIRYIDNEYVLLTLRFGYLGLLCFLTAAIASAWTLTRLHDIYAEENLGLLVAYVAAGLMSVMVVIFTVWMPHDYGFVLLWTFGVASGLSVAEYYGYLESRPRAKSDQRNDRGS